MKSPRSGSAGRLAHTSEIKSDVKFLDCFGSPCFGQVKTDAIVVSTVRQTDAEFADGIIIAERALRAGGYLDNAVWSRMPREYRRLAVPLHFQIAIDAHELRQFLLQSNQ